MRPTIATVTVAAASLLLLGSVSRSEDQAGAEQAAQEGWITVEIPQLGGSFRMPGGWHRPTSEEALQSLDHIAYDTEAERGQAEMVALAIGRMRVWVTRDPEPSPEFNPGMDIMWNDAGAALGQVPPAQRGFALAKFMSEALIPQIKENDDKFRLLEGPKPMQDVAWATFIKGQRLKSGDTVEAVVRLNLMMTGDKLAAVSLLLPTERAAAEKVNPVIWDMFKSLKLGGRSEQ